jgi:hypothetical protein
MICDKQIQEEIEKINKESITDKRIIEDIGMAEMPLLTYLLSLKYKALPQVIPIENDLMISLDIANDNKYYTKIK